MSPGSTLERCALALKISVSVFAFHDGGEKLGPFSLRECAVGFAVDMLFAFDDRDADGGIFCKTT